MSNDRRRSPRLRNRTAPVYFTPLLRSRSTSTTQSLLRTDTPNQHSETGSETDAIRSSILSNSTKSIKSTKPTKTNGATGAFKAVNYGDNPQNITKENDRPGTWQLKCVDLILLSVGVGVPCFVYYYHHYLLSTGQDMWEGWESDPGPWCEVVREKELLKERANASSDYCFLLVGLYMVRCGARDYVSRTTTNDSNSLLVMCPSLSVLAGILNIVHFCGTFMNHACRCFIGHRADVMGMYAVVGFFLPFGAIRYFMYVHTYTQNATDRSILTVTPNDEKKTFVQLSSLLCILLLSVFPLSNLTYATHALTETVEALLVGTLVVSTLAFESLVRLYLKKKNLRLANDKNYMMMTIISFLVGVLAQKADIRGIGCYPSSMLQLHALWHLMACLTIFFAYTHFRSEICVPVTP